MSFREPPPPPDQRAVIDIGSNTVRLVIYGPPARAPVVLYNEKVNARLGKGGAEFGRMSDKAMANALAALARYAALLRLKGLARVDVVATAAVRDASNGPDFLARVAALGLRPQLLSGEEEALTSARGVLAAFPGARGVVADLGGGSLELTDIDGPHCAHGTSLPLGALRLPALRAEGTPKFARRVRKLMRAANWAGAHGQTLYLVGGSWRALARYAMSREAWPVDDPHGFVLGPAAALRLARTLAVDKNRALRATARAGIGPGIASKAAAKAAAKAASGLSASRLSSLPDAAALLGVLVRELQPAALVFSAWGLREGVLASSFAPEIADADPLLAGVSAFVAGADPALIGSAALVFDWTAAADPADDPAAVSGGARLRRAAVLLALAAMRIEPNLRSEQASDWALRKRWIGVDAEGRARLALALQANSGRLAISADLQRLVPAARAREALAWGLAIRLCRRLTGLAPAAMAQSALVVAGGRLVLSAEGQAQALYTDTVEKDLRLLAECLGLQPVFTASLREPLLAMDL